MKGLLIKDFLHIKGLLPIYSFLLLLYTLISIVAKSINVFCGVQLMVCVILTINTIIMDDKVKWSKYALSMPISRKDMVLQKYLLGLILMGMMFILSLLVSFFIPSANGSTDFKLQFFTLLSLLFIGILFFASLLPFMFMLGPEKGVLSILIIVFIYSSIIGALVAKFGMRILVGKEALPFMYAIPFVSILMLFLSMAVSIQIYKKKDF